MATTAANDAAAAQEPTKKSNPQHSLAAADYIVTTTNNYISRRAALVDPKTIELHGQSIVQHGVQLHGPLRISRYCLIASDTVLEPPVVTSLDDDSVTVVTFAVGTKTHIGRDCRVQAAAIGSYCHIGDHVTIGPRCILKDCVIVADGTTIPADTVVPPFSYLSTPGEDGALVRVELPPSAPMEWEEYVVDYYHRFVKELNGGGGNTGAGR
jgi:dynactin 5